MSASEWAAVISALAAAVLVGALVMTLTSLSKTLGALRATVEDLHRDTIPLLADVHQTVRTAGEELERVDALLVTANSLGETVDSASKLALIVFSNPAVKAIAFAAGVRRAQRRMSRRRM